MYKYKDLCGLKNIEKDELLFILDTAKEMKKCIDNNDIRTQEYKNYSAMTLFYEDSTRTKMSFLLACEYLGIKVVDLNVATSSKNKGESLLDTALNIDEMGTDLVIMRHNMTGAQHFIAKNMSASVISGGDGANEHPTQALLDLYTMREKLDDLQDKNIVIVGDVKHSRVAKSNIFALTKLGANVTLVGPSTYVPDDMQSLGVKVSYNLKESVKDADVIMALRVQLERHKTSQIPSLGEYNKFFGVSEEVLKNAKKNVIVMHPGPVNRGVELNNDVIDCEKSVILEQVKNGVAVRMAIMKILLDNKKEK